MNNKTLEIKQILTLAYENHKKNNLELAESLYKKILIKDPNHIETNYLFGTLILQKKNFDEAIKILNNVIKLNPNHFNAMHNISYALIEKGEYKKAEELLNTVINIKPNHVDAHYNLANIYKHFAEFEKAEKFYKKAIQINPNNAKAFNNLGNILKDLGKFDEAINSYKTAIKLQNNHANAYHNLGNTYKQLGEFKKAKIFFEESLKHNPTNLETLATKIELNKEIIDVKQKKKILSIMEIKNLNNKDIAYGNFLLARYEQQRKNFEKEFDFLLKGHSYYYKWGKKKYEQGVKYWFNTISKNQELMDLGKSHNIGNEQIKPIFIVGVPRCGSTLIEKVIASGKNKISIGEETAIISFFVGQKIVANDPFKNNFKKFKDEIIEKYKSRGLVKEKNNYIFTDKSLDNFFFIGLIKEIFPNAKVINCKRNPLSSIMSILKNNLGDVSWAHDVNHIFKFFDIYHDKINSFKKIHPNFVYEIELEKFVENPEEESKKLMKFCNLKWDTSCLEFYKRKDLTSKTASNIQIRKAIYKDPIEKHLPYKKFFTKYLKEYSWLK